MSARAIKRYRPGRGRIVLALLLAWAFSLSAHRAQAQIREATEESLIEQLEDKDVERRRDAAYEFVRRGNPSAAAIVALGKATANEDTQVRIQSLTCLARSGKKSSIVMSQLISCLDQRDAQVRYRAAAALGAIGQPAIAPLKKRWVDGSTDVRIAIAQALAGIGREAKSATEWLAEGLGGKEALPRYTAEALVALAPQDETTLLTIAEHADAAARIVGMSGLAALGSPSPAAMEKLKQAVSDSDSKIRETAIIVVAKSRLPVADKAASIEKALVDPSSSVRAAAIVAIAKASLPAEEFSLRIARLLKDCDAESANSIVKALAQLGGNARGALPLLVEVAPKEGIDAQQLSKTMASFGAAVVPDLLAAIEKQPSQEPIFSEALGRIGEPAVESLKLGLSSDVELVRLAATRALGGVRPMKRELLEKLNQVAKDSSERVRQVAVVSLIDSSKEADFAKETLLEATRDSSPLVRAAAIPGLRHFQWDDQQKQDVVVRGLKDPSGVVRSSALATLAELPKLLQARAEQLAELIQDDDAAVRIRVVQTLSKLDKKTVNEAVVRACVTGLSDSDHAVRVAATETVKALSITEKPVLDALSANLIDDPALLRATLEAVSGFGEKAAPMIDAILNLAKHEKSEIRVAALNALAAIDKDAPRLAGRLIESLNDKDWEVRRVAGVAIGKLGPDAKNAVPKLFELLASDEDRDYASSALKEINTAPLEAIPLLIQKLDSEERRTSFYAVSILGKIGPPAAEALPKLEAMLAKPGNDPGRAEVRRKFLVEAIAAIKGEVKAAK